MKNNIIKIVVIVLFGLILCGCNKEKNYKLVDKTEEKSGFICATALDEFYKDSKYTYYWNCMKNAYMVVQYDNGEEETISEALKNKKITIKDLDDSKIEYIKK